MMETLERIVRNRSFGAGYALGDTRAALGIGAPTVEYALILGLFAQIAYRLAKPAPDRLPLAEAGPISEAAFAILGRWVAAAVIAEQEHETRAVSTSDFLVSLLGIDEGDAADFVRDLAEDPLGHLAGLLGRFIALTDSPAARLVAVDEAIRKQILQDRILAQWGTGAGRSLLDIANEHHARPMWKERFERANQLARQTGSTEYSSPDSYRTTIKRARQMYPEWRALRYLDQGARRLLETRMRAERGKAAPRDANDPLKPDKID